MKQNARMNTCVNAVQERREDEAAMNEATRKRLLEGVREIPAPGIPGPLVLTSAQATALICGKSAEGVYEPVVAAVEWQSGRALAFGHDGYFNAEVLASADTARLMLNAVRWLSRDKREPMIGVYRQPAVAEFLRRHGLQVVEIDPNRWKQQVSAVQVVVCTPASLTPSQIQETQTALRRGKGLLLAGLGWGWLQLNPGKNIQQHPGNLLLAPAGVLWTDGYLERTTPAGYRADIAPPAECHAGMALNRLQRGAPVTAQMEKALIQAVRTLPSSDRQFLPALRRLCGSVPLELRSLQKPITKNEPLARLAMAVEIETLRTATPDRVRAHPSAQRFPGAVPPDAVRVRRTVQVDTRIPRWHSTGLYAPPGQTITITLPSSAAGRGLCVRIGVHTDTLWHLQRWERAPEISFQFALNAPRTLVANAFGGTVLIDVPEGCQLGTVPVTIEGAVEAPYYVRGETATDAWKKHIRHAPAPWAELQGRRVILSVPSRVVRALDDVESVLAFWDAVVDACAELAGIPAERPFPERYVCDQQISAGYMHSGYPIMTHMDVAELVVDVEKLKREGSWGHFHEMGHNHQSPDWTFEGTGEVTVNLFSMYIYHRVLGQPFDQGHPAIRDRQKRLERVREYIARGARFDEWKNDPFLALTMYIQVIEQFGWEPIRKVIAEYHTLSPSQRPRTDDEKRDQWMVRLSRAVGRNLAPFFDRWGVPISAEARTQVAHLPVWLPEEIG